MNIEKLIKNLDLVSIIEFKNYITENLSSLCSTKNSNSKVIFRFKSEELFCEKCGGKLHKNGKTKTDIQNIFCSGCKITLLETSNTIVCHSKLSFEIWKNVIDNLLNGFSIRRIAEIIF